VHKGLLVKVERFENYCPTCTKKDALGKFSSPCFDEVISADASGLAVIDWVKYVSLREEARRGLSSAFFALNVFCFEGSRDAYYDVSQGNLTLCESSPVGVYYFVREHDAIAYMHARYSRAMYAVHVRRLHLIKSKRD